MGLITNTCPDAVIWATMMALGAIASLVSLWFAIGDRRSLTRHLAAREADVLQRALGQGMVRRMNRTANHAVFTETLRLLGLSLFLSAGAISLLAPPHACTFNLLAGLVITGGALVALNSLHALYARRGNDFSEGPSDEADAERDEKRDAHRDPGRDEGRDIVRDPARDTARDTEHDAG